MNFKLLSQRGFSALLATLLLTSISNAIGFQPLSGVTKVATGDSHTCAVTGTGGVQCWGRNYFGALGDGSSMERWTAVDVIGLGGTAAAVSAGLYHTCALLTSGAVKCWGDNWNSAAGGPAYSATFTTPTLVTGLESGIVAISSRQHHNCALTGTGGVKCWGSNWSGERGTGTTGTPQGAAGDVIGLTSGVSAIATSTNTACALTVAGDVKCWGGGSTSPVTIQGMTGVTQIAGGGNNYCALMNTNAVRCWYALFNGPLFITDIAGLSGDIAAITVGDSGHYCAINASGNTFCWGTNDWGQLGDGTLTARATPVDITANAGQLVSITAGGQHTCGITATAGVFCWGANGSGQLGNGVIYNQSSPTDVLTLGAGVAKVRAGSSMACAVMQAGGVKCWGSNTSHALGDGTTKRRETPVDVVGLQSDNTSIANGGDTTCALTTAGKVKCWGFGYSNGTAVEITGFGTGATDIAVGDTHICAIVPGGGVKCMGGNSYGQLGDTTQIGRSSPVYANGLTSGAIAIAAGSGHTCALLATGTVKCWGSNARGELGDGTTQNRVAPVDVGMLTNVVAISAGGFTTCAITAAGALKCWGANSGQVGDGTNTDRTLPADVVGMGSGVLQVSNNYSHTCAVMTSGQAKCWGYNRYGQLGIGSTIPQLVFSPMDVSGLSNAISIAAGDVHTCAVTATGAAKCWGDNTYGSLGNGVSAYSAMPTAALTSDSTPDAFGFSSQLSVARSSTRTSNTIVISGMEVAAGISISGGEYSIGCNGTFANWAGTIQPSESVCVRHTASAAANTSVTTTLMIGSTSGTFTSTTAAPVNVAFPDFNADGRPDILWRNAAGTTYLWSMSGVAFISDQLVTNVDPSWKLDGVADFNGDGHPDIVWRNGAGDTYVWYLVNGVFQSDAFLFSLPPEWVIQGIADFNADGKPDFLMRNTNSGNAFVWFFNNNVATGDQFLFNIDPSWKVEGVADLNADGQPDLLFRNISSGLAFAWNTQFAAGSLSLTTSSPPIFGIDPVWEIVQVADWNSDGKPDLLFRNKDTGLVFVWYLDGVTLTTSDFITQIDPSWEIVPRR